MPTADLDAVMRVLPKWVVVGAWVAMPLLLVLGSLFLIWLCARCTRVPTDGLHWTEIGRLRHTSRSLLGRQVFLQVVMTAFVAYGLQSEDSFLGARFARGAITGFLVWLGSRPIVFQHVRRHQPTLTVREFANGQALMVIAWVIPAIAVAMALLGPVPPDSHVAYCVAFYAAGLLAMWWLARRGLFTIARVVGLVIPANARLQTLVANVQQRTGHAIRRAWILRTAMANAAAFPHSNELLVTTGALDAMTDAELTAILLHEAGHLRESRGDTALRGAGLLPFAAIALWQPVAVMSGPWVSGAVILASVVAVRFVARRARRLEEAADHHAHEHLGADEPGAYARTLERLYAVNLMPAVVRGKRSIHPSLHDRMVAAGVTPEWPRPLPPPRRPLLSFVLLVLTFSFALGAAVAFVATRSRIYESTTMAGLDFVLSSGDRRALGAIGYHWLDERPADAAIVLSWVAERSLEPEHSAWLAIALARSDEPAARASLARAEQLLARHPYAEDWQRETVAVAREWLPEAGASRPR